ncbi:Crp/Fnr family transcriptional regulator [Flavobacteriaceae bacterium AU392]|nr:Crp/Fnr family transcriptional regulator [Flavobacteriaceae bacterium]RKM85856.1 Crp/Fnr family transcriptional regulator [Flavobacteriaceae bacterium AU392]
MKTSFLAECFPVLEKELLTEIEKYSTIKSFLAKEYIVKQGTFIRFLPIVLTGNIKVFSDEDTVQFLLYYISSGGSCIYSFAHTFNNEPVEFSAIAELDSELLLLPLNKVNQWLKKYPSFGHLVLTDYQKHYKDLLNTAKQITCYNLDQRLLHYLKNKAQIENTNLLNISHQEIANDLGTSREVISRLLKKLSVNNKVIQIGRKIKIL